MAENDDYTILKYAAAGGVVLAAIGAVAGYFLGGDTLEPETVQALLDLKNATKETSPDNDLQQAVFNALGSRFVNAGAENLNAENIAAGLRSDNYFASLSHFNLDALIAQPKEGDELYYKLTDFLNTLSQRGGYTDMKVALDEYLTEHPDPFQRAPDGTLGEFASYLNNLAVNGVPALEVRNLDKVILPGEIATPMPGFSLQLTFDTTRIQNLQEPLRQLLDIAFTAAEHSPEKVAAYTNDILQARLPLTVLGMDVNAANLGLAGGAAGVTAGTALGALKASSDTEQPEEKPVVGQFTSREAQRGPSRGFSLAAS